MKIPSFKCNFKALGALAKSRGHTKKTLSQQQRLMGQGMEEECPLPSRKLSAAATKGLFSPTLDMHPTQIPSIFSVLLKKLSTVNGYMGSNSMFIVCDCTCKGNTTLRYLIQSEERITESTGNVFHAMQSEVQYAGQLAHRQQNGDWVECRVTPRG